MVIFVSVIKTLLSHRDPASLNRTHSSIPGQLRGGESCWSKLSSDEDNSDPHFFHLLSEAAGWISRSLLQRRQRARESKPDLIILLLWTLLVLYVLTFHWSKYVTCLIPVAENYILSIVGRTEKLHGKGNEYKHGQRMETIKAIYRIICTLELIKCGHDVGFSDKLKKTINSIRLVGYT